MYNFYSIETSHGSFYPRTNFPHFDKNKLEKKYYKCTERKRFDRMKENDSFEMLFLNSNKRFI